MALPPKEKQRASLPHSSPTVSLFSSPETWPVPTTALPDTARGEALLCSSGLDRNSGGGGPHPCLPAVHTHSHFLWKVERALIPWVDDAGVLLCVRLR